jgi:roadblock/LC7 domain-containing protein
MDWKSLGESLAKIGLPLLGAALPLPGGMALGTALAGMVGSPSGKPEDILAHLTQSADAMEKAREFETTHQETLLKITVDAEIEARKADSADIAMVNATMQAETNASASESWYQKAWRPFNGFVVGAGSFVSVLFVCYLFYEAIVSTTLGMSVAAVIGMIPQLATSIALILSVPGAAVGIAAWHRGKLQRIEAGDVPK